MSQILQTTLSSLWPLLGVVTVLTVLGALLRQPRVKGWWGELQVRRMIREGLNPHLYVDLHNVTLPTPGGSTQIDHLIVSPYGVFVLETKNLKGWIFGSARQPEWTQKLHKRHSQKFQNPLRQNYKHTQAVQVLLALAPEHVHSVVAFVGGSHFKTEMPPQVTQGRGFIAFIQQFQQEVWGPEAMQDLLDRLEQVRLQPSRATQRDHVAHVQQLRAGKVTAAASVAASVAAVEVPAVSAPARRTPVAAAALPEVTVPTVAPDSPPPASTAASSTVPRAPRPNKICPQCQAPLRRMRMQRGPLAGNVVYRCSDTEVCRYVQALPSGYTNGESQG